MIFATFAAICFLMAVTLTVRARAADNHDTGKPAATDTAPPEVKGPIPFIPPPETAEERKERHVRERAFDACIIGERLDALDVRHAVYASTPECEQWR
jgi:hypothetical protein